MFAYFGNGNLSVKDLKYPSYDRFISMFYHSFKIDGFTRFAFTLHATIFNLTYLPFTLKKGEKGRPLEGLGLRP
jgi:hypothetical protein